MYVGIALHAFTSDVTNLSFNFCLMQISEAIEHEKAVSKSIKIYNVDRAVCGRIAGVIAKKYGDTGFAGQLNVT